MQDLLTNRTQRTRIGTSFSGSCNFTSVVIQGSCIGPLLFVLYDVVNMFNNAIESKLYVLNDLVAWSNKWQLTISFNMLLYASRPVQHNSRP